MTDSPARDDKRDEDSADASERMLPCPSCDETDVDATFARSSDGEFAAGCMVCGMTGPWSNTAADSADRWNALPRRTTPSHVGPSEPPMVYDPNQGEMVAPGQRGKLVAHLRQLFDKTADAHDGDYAEKVSHAIIAVYAYGRRQTTPSTTLQLPACPKCGEKDVQAAGPDWTDRGVEAVITCPRCEHTWTADFQIACTASARRQIPAAEVAVFLGNIVLDVAEIPDRTSPDDQPEIMLVTGEELKRIVANRLLELCERMRTADGGKQT